MSVKGSGNEGVPLGAPFELRPNGGIPRSCRFSSSSVRVQVKTKPAAERGLSSSTGQTVAPVRAPRKAHAWSKSLSLVVGPPRRLQPESPETV